jgi:hypothetical protein
MLRRMHILAVVTAALGCGGEVSPGSGDGGAAAALAREAGGPERRGQHAAQEQPPSPHRPTSTRDFGGPGAPPRVSTASEARMWPDLPGTEPLPLA